ncbi:MAG: hypothetical protein U1F43_05085 [Myxococcota bacterium]
MKLALSSACLIPIAALFVACDDGATGIALDFEPATTTSALTLATDFEATRLEALVSEIKILPDKDPVTEEKDDKFKAKGDFWIDALDPEDSIIPTIPLSANTYKKVEFKFDKPKSGSGIDGTDAAIALDATIDGVKVALRLGATEKVTLRDVSGIALASGGTSTFLVELDVPSWFDGVDVTTLDVGTDGVALIDSKTNKAAYDTIAANVLSAIKLARKP